MKWSGMKSKKPSVNETRSQTANGSSKPNVNSAPFLPPSASMSRTRLSAVILLVLSLAGSIFFLAYGIGKARNDADESFTTRATELVQTVETAWREYENAALSTHNMCRRSRNTTRKEFREFYEYLAAGGLEVESVQCCPNVTHQERTRYEDEAAQFYADHYPAVNYSGFIGFITDKNEPGGLIVVPSPELPFYFPVHYLEPVLPNAPAIDLDLWSYPSQRNEIDLAVSSREAVLSKRLHTVQETQEGAYSVIINHPGIFLESDPDDFPTELSLVLVRIPSLLERVARVQEENLAVYLYDTTVLNTGGDAEFLGAGIFRIAGQAHTLELLPEIEYEAVLSKYDEQYIYEEEVKITASGTWIIVVVPVDDTYHPVVAYVIFGGCMILAAGVFVAMCYYSNSRRDARLNETRMAAEADKAALIVENAEQAAASERELNDFLAHEVRNPLGAAMSACSFLSSAVNDEIKPLTREDMLSIKDDVDVIDTNLRYINDLLRNMLDMHKASCDSLDIKLSPVGLLSDVLEPVVTMLYQRSDSFEVTVDCPEQLMVLTDQIRLTQIILNLANNARKFVEQGFIRIRGTVLDGKVVCMVEDSGPGIPLSKQDHLFEKFQVSLDSLSQGTGIGLCLCKNLAELMHGDISLDKDYHSGIEGCPGARFVINLNTPPLQLFEDDDDDDDDDVDDTPLEEDELLCGKEIPTNFKVMFVDDDLVLRKLFTRSIERVAPNWEIHCAANGETAIRLIGESTTPYDLVFLDQYMASIQKQLLGTETARALRSKGFKGIICGLSANSMEEAFISAGANAFIIKPLPCDRGQLKNELRRVLSSDTPSVSEAASNDSTSHEDGVAVT